MYGFCALKHGFLKLYGEINLETFLNAIHITIVNINNLKCWIKNVVKFNVTSSKKAHYFYTFFFIKYSEFQNILLEKIG
jgi:hypothetical protein